MEVVIKLDPRKKEAQALLEYLDKLPFVETVITKKASAKDIMDLSRQVNKSLSQRLDKDYNYR